ncbi:MarR family winged helix-turn-helix transcriptional regulator [Latilactobacillus fragifolii]|uniref:MarR family winged helix-turn-helix transcriptional regulator n=1 Tax=Latilactobacillus fragifolii TaxID=2814244 RepID=UPI001ABABBE4|nr:MarR family transcriptional regulator [Latilactobacillus fragifolii]
MEKIDVELLIDWYVEVQNIVGTLDQIAATYNLNFAAFRILDQIYQSNSLSPRDLSEIEKTSPPAVSRKLNLLQVKGYICKRRDDPHDQRLVKLEITTKGKEAYFAIKESLDAKSIEILSYIKKAEYRSIDRKSNI